MHRIKYFVRGIFIALFGFPLFPICLNEVICFQICFVPIWPNICKIFVARNPPHCQQADAAIRVYQQSSALAARGTAAVLSTNRIRAQAWLD